MNVRAAIAYAGRGIPRPRYHANDTSRDLLEIVPTQADIVDARELDTTLDGAGFMLVEHRSSVGNFTDRAALEGIHRAEITALLGELSGADRIIVSAPGVLRFSERAPKSGMLDNSRPARFAHVDINDATAAALVQRVLPQGQRVTRFAHYNVWRVISAPPQDVPLAVCDARSLSASDLILADAVFDSPDRPEWSFEGLVFARHAAHRWHWFPDMTPDEALVFKTNDSDPARAHCVPHVAFDNPLVGADAPPRTSIEMRGIALWFE